MIIHDGKGANVECKEQGNGGKGGMEGEVELGLTNREQRHFVV